MRLDKPQGRRGEKDAARRTTDKKPRGKVAPRKIFELDEDMTITSKPKAPASPRGGLPQSFGTRARFGRSRKPRKSQRGMAEQRDMGPKEVTIEGPITVAQFAEKLGVAPTEIIRKVLVDVGEALTMNAVLTEELIELIAPDYNVELNIIPVGDEYDVEEYVQEDDPDKLVRRPPVVTIMGHVDHGKTSLLDFIRKSKVVAGEYGGITQHIGAYLVSTAKGDIVFLDTPGHEAFTSMRARGAGVTDLVILVVAADDGFMPQTIEAINHSKAAGVPLVVAINKIDLPAADPARVKKEALQHNLIPEDLGGDTIFVEISAKTGLNVDNLLEMVALQAEILDLKANPDRPAQGIIIESHVDPHRGAVATVLVQRGTLRVGDHFVTGNISGRVRAMNNDRGKSVKTAGPSHPAEILGLTGSPGAGESVVVVPDEQVARDIAERREIRRRATDLAPVTNKHVTLENLHDFIEEGKTRDLNMIIKADVQGSMEAVRQSLEKITSEEIKIRILHTAVGGINESDVNLAAASDAIIIGFNVRPEASAQELANHEGVDIKTYRIIYDLIEDVKAAMVGMLSPTFKEKITGHAEIRQVFRASRLGNIAGCYVKDGEIIRDSKARLLRDNVVIYEGQLSTLRRIKEDVKKVTTGMECGITLNNFNDIKEGDIIEGYQLETVAPTLASVTSSAE
jgi:translation initiation factor IF-2